jgi:hypothetical protein
MVFPSRIWFDAQKFTEGSQSDQYLSQFLIKKLYFTQMAPESLDS